MRKIFAGLVLFGLTITGARAVAIQPTTCSKCDQDLMPGGYWNGTDYDTCEEMCNAIQMNKPIVGGTAGEPNEYGVYVYQTWTYEETCGAYVETPAGLAGRLGNCHAVAEDHYMCGRGYYGTATSETSSGCTKCPANANCNTGGTTFYCNPGYYKSGSSCAKCPNPTTGSGDEGSWTVSSSIKVGGNASLPIGASGGATSIGQCYLTNASVVTDNTGTYEIEGATGIGSSGIIIGGGTGKWCDYYGKY